MSSFTTRPVIYGRKGIVTAGHYLAAHAGMRMLEAGGNAIDAGVAAGFALNVLEPHNCGIAGEAPMLIYHARSGRLVALSGQGTAPAAMTIDWFRSRGIGLIPGDGLLPATVPAAADAWITALDQFGTLPLATVLAPALELAEEGFAVNRTLSQTIAISAPRFREEWPGSADIYLPEGHVPQPGDRLRQVDWARTMRQLVTAEQQAAGRSRSAGLLAARDVFYHGPIAERIADFVRSTPVRDATGQSHTGFLMDADMAGYHSRIEAPVSVTYRGLDVYKCGPWTQGPVFLQQLTLLDGFNLQAMGANSTEYIHTVVECSKLAFADREFYYGDPEFAKVPLDRLLSKAYADERRGLVDPAHASLALRPGNAGPHPAQLILGNLRINASDPTHADGYGGDTTHLDAVDAEGNMIAATVSGAWIPSSPVIPGLGFPLGTRAQMFSLDPEHPDALAPGKRPRTTLTPSLIMKRGQPWWAFGTQGGDQQDQWTLQFFLNVIEFGMDLQAAIDTPTFHSLHFPSSFYPRAQYPGRLVVEGRIPPETQAALAARGHEIVVIDDWGQGGRVMGVQHDAATGFLRGAATPRNETATRSDGRADDVMMKRCEKLKPTSPLSVTSSHHHIITSSAVAAVLFDLDGTLVDSHIDFGRMRREMLELAGESGCELTALAGADILQIRDAFCARAADAGEALRRAEVRLVRIEREAMERSTPVEGAGTLLTALRGRGVRVGIVTRNCREIAVDSLRRHGLPYDILIAREDTPRVKPHPEHLLRALAALAVAPERAVMVGDGRMDIEAGVAGGLRTVGYLAPDRPADYFAGLAPDHVIRRLTELIPWICPSSS